MKPRFTPAAVLDRLRSGLVVSCQAYPGEPLRNTFSMTQMARAAELGGAHGLRAQGIDDIVAIRGATGLPLIGLIKTSDDPVYITPTLEHALAVAEAGADIVAIDGTGRSRPDGRTVEEIIRELHARTPTLVMADIGSVEDAHRAAEAGADLIATTLAGYTGARSKADGPDIELVRELAAGLGRPVVAEGRFRTPQQAQDALRAGAHAIVIGTAITHPTTVTSWFVEALAQESGAHFQLPPEE